MKVKHLFIYIILAVGVTMTTACEMDSNDNGALDGFWHLERIDTLVTGGVNNTADDYLFWCVQSRLVEVGDRRNGYKPGILFSFRHEGSVLSFYNPLHSDRANGDRPVEDVDDLRPYGINEMEEHFDVETLNGSKMVLRSKVLRLVFKKF